jgi:COUP transcription factor 2
MNETNSLSLLSQPCTSVNQLIKTKKSSHFLHDILDIKSENELLNEDHSTTTTMMISSNSFSLAHYHTLNTSRNHTNRLVECVVCHDKSSGKHYGQYTCEGCKSFFKRSVRRNLIYQCRSTRNCPIDQHHRNQCQHCRFKKCIKMGMRREAVQRGRTPIQPANHLKTSNKNTSSKETVNNNNNINENIALFSNINPNDLISNFAAKTIFNIFEWSLSIPLFSTLNQNDRIELLINSWQQLFILFCAQSNNIDDLFKSNDEIKQFQIELNRIKSLLLDFEESNYLKAIILFNPGIILTFFHSKL